MATAHYLEALDWQRDIIRAHAVLGARTPIPNFLVGGMSMPVDPNSQNALNAGSIALLGEIAKKCVEFVSKVFIPDLMAVASFTRTGPGTGGSTTSSVSANMVTRRAKTRISRRAL